MRLDGDAAELQVAIDVAELVVRVVGPRYTGGLRLRVADCADGRVLLLKARPRPATLRWRNPPADMVVRCVEDCVGGLPHAERWPTRCPRRRSATAAPSRSSCARPATRRGANAWCCSRATTSCR
ncbi:MAG: hypothetical protein U0168_19145 [Nannocystaceae bacterium]